MAQFCRIQPKRLYVINTCICNVVEAVEVEAKLHITDYGYEALPIKTFKTLKLKLK